jgi:hypothetical protein
VFSHLLCAILTALALYSELDQLTIIIGLSRTVILLLYHLSLALVATQYLVHPTVHLDMCLGEVVLVFLVVLLDYRKEYYLGVILEAFFH